MKRSLEVRERVQPRRRTRGARRRVAVHSRCTGGCRPPLSSAAEEALSLARAQLAFADLLDDIGRLRTAKETLDVLLTGACACG